MMWEYEVVWLPETGDIARRKLNSLGSKGWELISVVPQSGKIYAYLRRAKVELFKKLIESAISEPN